MYKNVYMYMIELWTWPDLGSISLFRTQPCGASHMVIRKISWFQHLALQEEWREEQMRFHCCVKFASERLIR